MDKKFLAILVVVVLVFVGIFTVSKHQSPGSGATQATNHVEGQNKANVTLLEYGDFECPVCFEYFNAVKQAEVDLSSQIHFQFRELPLTAIHKNAFAAARAAEAAGLQGKFWQMHDLIYQNQDPTGQSGWVASSNPLNQYFDGFAQQLKLNLSKFNSDYASSQVADSINADISAFGKTGQQEATPTFFVNDKFVDNSNFIDSTRTPSAAKIVAYIKNVIDHKQ